MKTVVNVALATLVLAVFMATPALAQPSNKQWTFEAEALFLHRNATKGVAISTAGTSVVLGTSDLKFGFEPGVRFTLGFHPDPSNSLELVYFGLHNWSDRAKRTCPLGDSNSTGQSDDCLFPVFADGDADPPSGSIGSFTHAFQHSIRYQSKLHNVELNYKRHFSPWGNLHPSLLVGLRYVSVPERFNFLSVDDDGDTCPGGGDCGIYNIRTKNHLFGVQFGGVGTYRFGPSFDLGLRVKAGLFANWAKQRSRVLNESSSDTFNGSNSRTGAAGVADAGLFATWNFTPNIALTGGYQVLYVTGLALAPEQFATSPTTNATSQLNNSGSTFYHGPSVGLKVSW